MDLDELRNLTNEGQNAVKTRVSPVAKQIVDKILRKLESEAPSQAREGKNYVSVKIDTLENFRSVRKEEEVDLFVMVGDLLREKNKNISIEPEYRIGVGYGYIKASMSW